MIGFLNKLLQSILPHHFLCQLMHRITRIQNPGIKNFTINHFINTYQIDMQRYARTTANEYKHFNDFFTRELSDIPALPANGQIYSPVDGFVSEYGKIKNGSVLQAKNIDYRITDLLADKNSTNSFVDGHFITLYLSPKNYHRIHCPYPARLTEMRYVPGHLYGVGNLTRTTLDGLYVKNERLIMHFRSEHGRFAVVMIGAIFVGSMETVWQGIITPNKSNVIQNWQYPEDDQYQFKAGEEISRFNMGSTVIMLFEKDMCQWHQLELQQAVLMGTPLAQCGNTNSH